MFTLLAVVITCWLRAASASMKDEARDHSLFWRSAASMRSSVRIWLSMI
ncbi:MULTISPECIES: hypothetical protein [Synechococcales]|nr:MULTISPECIES: hypothetical protein [Synechococcales]MCP9941703.1 hypothetical protein [Cyanobium sp. ATX 6E8]